LLEVPERTKKVSYLKIANVDDIQLGMEVFAFGHPMGMAWSLSRGIISSKDRHSRHPYIKSLQTDAAINKGNSGGPLLNLKGEIVGINTLMISRNQQNAGVGISIRSDVVKNSLVKMLERGRVDRPAIGVMIISLLGRENQRNTLIKDNPELKKILPNTYGLLIRKDPAELPAGIKVWDTIVGVNNIPVNNGVEFSDQLIKYNIGTKIELTIIRNKRYIQVEVPLKVLPVPADLMYGKKLLIPPKKIP
jgi:serine protease Do